MKIAIAQTEIIFEQPEKNLANAAAWIAQAAAAQADCIVFPEMSFTGFSMQVEKILFFHIMKMRSHRVNAAMEFHLQNTGCTMHS